MPEIICNTSPLQYLHQIGHLHLLPALAGRIIVPPAVEMELEAGRKSGVSVPDLDTSDWLVVRRPQNKQALSLIIDLGPGETEVLMLALESADPVVILDDGLARRFAEALRIRLTGTVGLLLDAKRAGLIAAVAPLLDQLKPCVFGSLLTRARPCCAWLEKPPSLAQPANALTAPCTPSTTRAIRR